ncbi:hypothetical protein B0I27_10474 [Arcticibacter pallidicorallinus]|uniref:MORN repeat protein n=1 Tax=Arcticibacter pallidicorallinus TaxID=1259464 RepID=A0A2T0U569_9SPHI|nr:hypothetical protein [Arcticibacter pallidicorallinus]PRY53067.1 hypothetical protein B0I27_10474 [Arcticibacter pallidicorallinus]
MKIKPLHLIVLCLLTASCRTNQFKDNLRHGRWVYKDSTSNDLLISKGRYRGGNEIGKWKHYNNGVLFRLEKFKGDRAKVVNYYPDQTVESLGTTGLDRSAEMIHWYYDGKWKFYSEDGKLDSIKIFNKGELVSAARAVE